MQRLKHNIKIIFDHPLLSRTPYTK